MSEKKKQKINWEQVVGIDGIIDAGVAIFFIILGVLAIEYWFNFLQTSGYIFGINIKTILYCLTPLIPLACVIIHLIGIFNE